jgi:hypothetical protein
MTDWKFAETLLLQTWWAYPSRNPSWIEFAYHAFNLFEGAVWIVLAGLVLRRFIGFRHSRVELLYALAFFTFGLTDFQEAYALTSWLIWIKAINLLVLLGLRTYIMKRFYPKSSLY